MHNKMNKSQKQTNIDKLYHQTIASSSKMPKEDDCPVKDPEPDGSILKMKKWKSYALNANEERMDLLARKIQSITSV